MTNELTGIVLCGGLSSRMGKDKGLLLKNNIPWFRIALSKIIPFVSKSFVSINESQLESYSQLISTDQLIIDSSNVAGPLKGILSAHNAHPENDLLVLACDMTDMNENIIQNIINVYNTSDENYEAITYKSDLFFEPLCSIYTSSGLNRIKTELDKGKLKSVSMNAILKKLHTHSLILTNDIEPFFRNYNSPND